MVEALAWSVVGLISIVAIAGLMGLRVSLPVVTRAAEFGQPPEIIWQVLDDYRSYSTWRRDLDYDLDSVEERPSRDGHSRWCEVHLICDKPMPLWVERLESVPNERLVHRVRDALWPMDSSANPRLAFQGHWVYEISATSSGCEVRITERSSIENPFLKLFVRILLPNGHPIGMTECLVDLGRKFGEETQVTE